MNYKDAIITRCSQQQKVERARKLKHNMEFLVDANAELVNIIRAAKTLCE